MTRIITDVKDEKIKLLDEFASKDGVSRAALVRQAIDELIDDRLSSQTDDIMQYFGLWKKDGVDVDGLEYEREIRAEWNDRP